MDNVIYYHFDKSLPGESMAIQQIYRLIVRYMKILKTLIWENCLRIAEIRNLILNLLLCCALI